MIDIYSRKIVHAQVHTRESQLLGKDFITGAITANGGAAPGYVHSDNGAPMIGKSVTTLLSDLHITASLSRPQVSNDNPYSEAWNKTFKYAPDFPDRFDSLEHARAFLTWFVEYYNHEHRHSGIGLYTPASVHDGTWRTHQQTRQHTLDTAHAAHPERFRRGRPTAPSVPTRSWINPPTITSEPYKDAAA